MDPCQIIKESLVEFTDKDISVDMIFVEKFPKYDTTDMTAFWIGFKGSDNGFTVRVLKDYDEGMLRNCVWGVSLKMNKPDFHIK